MMLVFDIRVCFSMFDFSPYQLVRFALILNENTQVDTKIKQSN